ncbi:uncharacterized protein LOC119665868 [Teleopsis dalmanni]|uniref:uncharacterized protein LOC119665868 n=1 Tax=Teleopsis dalmanni TaxID=139649 RepID=UPI0018CED163|nr:uncharacterized protein LOC119665868 [Teleopsis dalmanni]
MEAQLQEIGKIQFQVLRLLIDVNHGKISSVLLRPEQLSLEIAKIKAWLPEKMKLPGDTSNQIATIIRLLTGEAIIVNSKLVIKIQIPLITIKFSNIFKVVPVPVKHGDTNVVASIAQPYLVYSHESDVYHLMSELEWRQCKTISDRQYLCEETWAWQDANDNSCEVSPLKPHKTIVCQFVEASNKHMWVNLNNRRQWIFRASLNATLHVFCDQKHQDLFSLPQQGLLILQSGCSGQIEKTQIPASNHNNVSTQGDFGIQLIKDMQDTSADLLKPLNSHLIDHKEDIIKIKQQIHRIQAEDWTLKGLHFHHATGHISLSILCIFIMIILVYFIRKCLLKGKANVIIIRRPQET